ILLIQLFKGRIFKQADGKFYEPSFGSMDCYLVLCAFVWFYGLLSRSMCLRLVLWPVISFYESSPQLCVNCDTMFSVFYMITFFIYGKIIVRFLYLLLSYS